MSPYRSASGASDEPVEVSQPTEGQQTPDPAISPASARALMDAVMELVQLSRSFADSEIFQLNRAQYAVLSHISNREGATLTAIADELKCDLSVLSRQTAALIEQGLAVRSKDPHDARAWQVSLTDLGHERLEQAQATRVGLVEQALAACSDQECAIATRVITSYNAVMSTLLKRKGIPLSPLATLNPTPPTERTQ